MQTFFSPLIHRRMKIPYMHLSVPLPILHINLGHPRQNERELIWCKYLETPLGNDLTGKVIIKEEKYDLAFLSGLPWF